MVLDDLYSLDEKEIMEKRSRNRIKKTGLISAPMDLSDDEDNSEEKEEGDEEQKEKVVQLDNKEISLLFSCLFSFCGIGLAFYIQSQEVENYEYIAGMIASCGLIIIGIVSFAWYYICWMDIEDFESQVKFAGEQMEMNKLNKKLRKSSSTVHGDGKEKPIFSQGGDSEIAVGDDGEEYDTSDICTSETTDNEDDLSDDDSEMRGAISFPSENNMVGDLAGGTEIEMAEVGEQNTYERPNKKRGPNSP